jgi:hypothetical protein
MEKEVGDSAGSANLFAVISNRAKKGGTSGFPEAAQVGFKRFPSESQPDVPGPTHFATLTSHDNPAAAPSGGSKTDGIQNDTSKTEPPFKDSFPYFQRLPFTDIGHSLSRYYEHRKAHPYVEYKTDGVITSDQLHASLALPFELTLTEDAGEVVVSPVVRDGMYDPQRQYSYYETRFLKSKLNMHTHNRRSDGLVIDTLSLQDLRYMHRVDTTTTILLAHEHGISEFRRLIYNLDGTPVNEDMQPASTRQASEIVYNYWKEKNFNPFRIEDGSQEMDDVTQTALAREFVQRTGMLVTTAGWEDDGIELLMTKLNLQNA